MTRCSSRSRSSRRRASDFELSDFDAASDARRGKKTQTSAGRAKNGGNETAPLLPPPLPLARRSGSCPRFLQSDDRHAQQPCRPLQASEGHHPGDHLASERGGQGQGTRRKNRRSFRPRASALGAPLPRRGALFLRLCRKAAEREGEASRRRRRKGNYAFRAGSRGSQGGERWGRGSGAAGGGKVGGARRRQRSSLGGVCVGPEQKAHGDGQDTASARELSPFESLSSFYSSIFSALAAQAGWCRLEKAGREEDEDDNEEQSCCSEERGGRRALTPFSLLVSTQLGFLTRASAFFLVRR